MQPNMITISETKDIDLIKTVVTNERLFYMHGYEIPKEQYIPNLAYIWLKIEQKNKLIGLFELRPYTSITKEVHIYILPEFQGSGLSVKAALKGIKFCKNWMHLRSLITYVPIECQHVLKFLQVLDAKVVGMLKNSIIYHNHLQDQIIYQVEVK